VLSCLSDLGSARTRACAADDSHPTPVILRQQVVFPHHTTERHEEEAGGELLVTRPTEMEAVLLETTAWFVPPADGRYELTVAELDTPCELQLGAVPVRELTAAALADNRRRSQELLGTEGSCGTGQRVLRKGGRYPFALSAVLGSSNHQMILTASVQTAGGTWHLPTPGDWFEMVAVARDDSVQVASVRVHELPAVCRVPGGCAVAIVAAEMDLDPFPRGHRMLDTIDLPGAPAAFQTRGAQADARSSTAPFATTVAHSQSPKRRLLAGCPSDCCVVIFRGAAGEECDPVSLWDFTNWVHPGGAFVQASMLCGTVRYSWLTRSGQHVLQVDPQDTTLTTLTGGAVKVGEFVDPACSSGGGDVQVGAVRRWSELKTLPGYGIDDEVMLPNGQVWLMDADMTVATLTIQGHFRWDTTIDGLVLSAGYVYVQRGGK
jgi:hypothetical protein